MVLSRTCARPCRSEKFALVHLLTTCIIRSQTIPELQDTFKVSTIHWNLQVARRIAFPVVGAQIFVGEQLFIIWTDLKWAKRLLKHTSLRTSSSRDSEDDLFCPVRDTRCPRRYGSPPSFSLSLRSDQYYLHGVVVEGNEAGHVDSSTHSHAQDATVAFLYHK